MHALQRTVVAEGIEDRVTWETLRNLGCDCAQGYYMGRPMPAAKATQWLISSPWGTRPVFLLDA